MAHPTKYRIINKAGYNYIIITIVIFLLSFLFHWFFSIIAGLILIWVVAFFRDPARYVVDDKSFLPSPADGKIVFCNLINSKAASSKFSAKKSKISPKGAISKNNEMANEEWLHLEAKKVSIFMNVFNVHVNRSPVTGKVIGKKYFKGKFFNASLDKASSDNERICYKLLTEDNKVVYVVQIAGLVARRIISYIEVGDNIICGQRIGLIKFGSRVDVYFPKNFNILVGLGQKVSAAESLLACRSKEKYNISKI